MNSITERVDEGVAFMDEHDPQWWRQDVESPIDLDRLDLASTRDCVLGQRCPLEVLAAHLHIPAGHVTGRESKQAYVAYATHLTGLNWRERREWSAQHGFTASDDDYTELTAAWREVIEQRRAAA